MPAVIVVALLRKIVDSKRFRSGVESAFAGDDGEGDPAADDIVEASGSSFLGPVGRTLFLLVMVSGVLWLVGQVLARQLTRGDERSDEFELAVFMGGAEFVSHAEQLRRAVVTTFWAGMSLDLRDATLGPDGADLELRTYMGGSEVRVPATWRVEIDQTLAGGAFEVALPGMEGLPEDAPTLRVRATTRIGGVLVTSTRE